MPWPARGAVPARDCRRLRARRGCERRWFERGERGPPPIALAPPFLDKLLPWTAADCLRARGPPTGPFQCNRAERSVVACVSASAPSRGRQTAFRTRRSGRIGWSFSDQSPPVLAPNRAVLQWIGHPNRLHPVLPNRGRARFWLPCREPCST